MQNQQHDQEQPNVLRCAIYTRSAFVKEGTSSAEAQEQFCRTEAQRLGWTVVDVSHDAGVSGNATFRGEGLDSLIAFRGLMTCAHDGCQLTGDVQKEKYVYYRCTGYHGKCELPRFREEEIGERLGEPLKGLQVPPEIVSQIVTMLREDQSQSADRVNAERTRLESRLTAIRNRMDAAYVDKLDGKISEDFWKRKTGDWRIEEQQIKMSIQSLETANIGDRALNAQRTFELANRAYSLYVSQNPTEKAKLLRMLLSNCSVV